MGGMNCGGGVIARRADTRRRKIRRGKRGSTIVGAGEVGVKILEAFLRKNTQAGGRSGKKDL